MKHKEKVRRMIEARMQLERERKAEEAIEDEKGFILKHITAYLKGPVKVKSIG